MRIFFIAISFTLFLHPNSDRPPIPYDFLAKKEVQAFIHAMVKKHHFSAQYMKSILQHAKLDRDTLARYTGKYKVGSTNGSWERYKAHVLDPVSLDKAKRFKKKYYATLLRASQEYNVDMDYIVGFIGVESKFGEYSGDYNILDALSTLAFHPNRMQKFFKSELEHLFLLAREQHYDIQKLQGSFAGAMGAVQQVPSIFRKFGMDYNQDGVKDPWDLEDAIGVIARFMHQNRWKKSLPAAIPATFQGKRFTKLPTTHRRLLPLKRILEQGVQPLARFPQTKAYLLKNSNKSHDELWLGTSNFRVLTTYNNSTSYGMAIHLIAQAVK